MILNDPSVITLVTSALEKAINGALKYDPATYKKLEKLEDTRLQLCCQQPEITLFFYILDNEFYVSSVYDGESDVCLTGKLTDLISLVLNGEKSLANTGVTVSGKVSVLTEYQNIFQDVEIDWEEPISDLFGTVAGHTLSQNLKKTFEWVKQSSQKVSTNLPVFLQEELNAIPSQTELEGFYSDVDKIKSDTTRAAARVQALKQKFRSPDKN